MIISFAWTTLALLTCDKTVTRRRWTNGYASRLRAGDLVDAYDRSPRAGGQKVATIRLACDPYRERLADMPVEDLAAEGGLWVSKEEFIQLFGGAPEDEVTVVRFELVQVEHAGLDLLFAYVEGLRQIQIALETERAWAERDRHGGLTGADVGRVDRKGGRRTMSIEAVGGAEAVINQLRAQGKRWTEHYETAFCPTCGGAGMGCPHCESGLVEVLVITQEER